MPSSVTRRAPSCATATPTGRPQTLPLVDHEAGQEILVLAGRDAVLEEHAHDLVARAAGAVPGAVEGREDVAAVLGRERGRAGGVLRDRTSSRATPNGTAPGTSGAITWPARSGRSPAWRGSSLVAHVVPGPAVEPPLPHLRDVVRHEVVAQRVALVGRAPEVAGRRAAPRGRPRCGCPSQTASGRLPLGIGHKDVGPVGLVAPGGAPRVRGLPGTDFLRRSWSASPRRHWSRSRPK